MLASRFSLCMCVQAEDCGIECFDVASLKRYCNLSSLRVACCELVQTQILSNDRRMHDDLQTRVSHKDIAKTAPRSRPVRIRNALHHMILATSMKTNSTEFSCFKLHWCSMSCIIHGVPGAAVAPGRCRCGRGKIERWRRCRHQFLPRRRHWTAASTSAAPTAAIATVVGAVGQSEIGTCRAKRSTCVNVVIDIVRSRRDRQ